MRYSSTGPTELLTVEAERIVADAIILLRSEVEEDPGAEFTSGAAYGADTLAARVACGLPFAVRRLTIPDGRWHNESLVYDLERQGWEIERVYGGYMRRNDATVSHTDIQVATPKTTAEERRSGTWATIRRARKAGCEVRVSPLDGSAPWVEPSTRLAL